MSTEPDYSQWMVRTRHNQLTGVFSKEELIQKIQAGELSREDEICAGNHFWFYLYESQELKNQLGIDFPPGLDSASGTATVEVDPEITEDVPQEITRTIHFQSGSKPAIVPAPLAPRLHRESEDEKPAILTVPTPARKPIPKAFFVLAALAVLWVLLKL